MTSHHVALRSLAENYITGLEYSVPNSLSDGIINNEYELVEIVECLGEYLTNLEKYVRARGILLLSETMQMLPRDTLSQKEVQVLVTFYCDRVKDHHSILPCVLKGLVTLSIQQNLPDQCAVDMVKAMFTEVDVRSQKQSDRQRVFTVILNLLNNKLAALQQMEASSGSFVHGFIQAVDSEKDPRNLILCFQAHYIVASNFPIQIFAEDMFEVVACYFPIDHTPPPNDPHGITKDDLVQGLRKCLSASSQFAEFCLPLLLEKFTSSITSAKIDALLTLAACADTYGAEKLNEYVNSFFYNMRTEMMSADGAMENACMQAMCAISKVMSQDEDLLTKFVTEAYAECERHLRDPQLKLMLPNGKFLQAIAQGSPSACSKVISKVMPLLTQMFYDHPQASHRKNIIDLILLFISVSWFNEEGVTQGDALYPLFTSLLSETSLELQRQGVHGLQLLAITNNMASEDKRMQVAQHMRDTLLQTKDKAVRGECTTSIALLGSRDPQLVIHHILPNLALNEGQDGHMTLTEKLEILVAISHHPDIVEYVTGNLLDHIRNANRDESLHSTCKPTCAALYDIIKNSRKVDNGLGAAEDIILTQCLSLSIEGALAFKEGPLVEEEVIAYLAGCIREIACQTKKTNSVIELAKRIFLNRDFSGLLSVQIESNEMFMPLKICTKWKQTQLIPMLTALLCSLKQENFIPYLEELLSGLWSVIQESSHQGSVAAACKCYAGLLNKLRDADLDERVTRMKQKMEEQLNMSADPQRQLQIFMLWVYITKAVVLNGHQSQNVFIDKLLGSLEDATFASAAAAAFDTILKEEDDVLNSDMHAVIRMMYGQRFYLLTFPHLIDKFTATAQENKKHYLTAVAHLLHHVPKQAFTNDWNKLLPLLMQSLAVDDLDLVLSSLTSFTDLLEQNAELLQSYVSDILPRLLTLASYKPSLQVRITALKCLGQLSHLPTHAIYPHQAEVVRTLAPVLDDHKRLVRHEAVKTRNKWFLLANVPS